MNCHTMYRDAIPCNMNYDLWAIIYSSTHCCGIPMSGIPMAGIPMSGIPTLATMAIVIALDAVPILAEAVNISGGRQY